MLGTGITTFKSYWRKDFTQLSKGDENNNFDEQAIT